MNVNLNKKQQVDKWVKQKQMAKLRQSWKQGIGQHNKISEPMESFRTKNEAKQKSKT